MVQPQGQGGKQADPSQVPETPHGQAEAPDRAAWAPALAPALVSGVSWEISYPRVSFPIDRMGGDLFPKYFNCRDNLYLAIK